MVIPTNCRLIRFSSMNPFRCARLLPTIFLAASLTSIITANRSLLAAEQPVEKDVVQITNPKSLGVDHLPVERIRVGIPEDYKPCLAKLPNGELLLTGFYASKQGGVPAEYCFLYRSSDGGRTWSKRRQLEILGREPYFSVISDGTLFISTHVLTAARGNTEGYTYSYLYRSTDGGRNWQGTKIAYSKILAEARKDGKRPEKATAITGRNVLELHDGSLLFTVASQHGSETLWRSQDKGITWDKTQTCNFDTLDHANYAWAVLQESTLWQAPDGQLLAVCRVSSKSYPPLQGGDIPQTNVDHYERMVLYRSEDEGHNWKYEEIGSYYGEMYQHLLRLNDDRLLFTFTMRAAVDPQKPPLGVRAVLGVEKPDGFVFQFQQDRIELDTKTAPGQHSGGGFGNTVEFDDGTLVTSCSYRLADTTTHCEVIRWKLKN